MITAGTTATAPTTTLAPSASYDVTVTPAVNPAGGMSGYSIVPVAPATGTTNGTGNLSSYTAKMIAPALAGTYTYTVWTNQGPDGAGVVGSASYTIKVDAASVVVTTTTALEVTPASPVVAPGNPTLKATVTGTGAAGTVEFFNGTTSLGVPSAISAGVASKTLTGVVAGSYSYKAVFTPTDATAFTSSTSAVSTYVVTAPVPAPTASFTASAISGIAPLAVTLTDTSTDATSWLWIFGNGSTSNVQNPPAVTYTTAGTHDVTLIVSNASGASAPVTQTITVTAAPPVGSTALITALSPRHGVVGDIVTIQGSDFGAAGTVQFGTVDVTVSSWNDTAIIFEVPVGTFGRAALVSVTPEGGTASNAMKFRFDHVRVSAYSHSHSDAPRHHVRLGGDLD